MLVAELNGDLVFSGCGRQVRYRHRAILVVVAAYFSLAGSFDSQRETACAGALCRDGKVSRFAANAVDQTWSICRHISARQGVDMEFKRRT